MRAMYSRRMTHTTRALLVSLLVLGAAACGKANGASKGTFEPCSAAALTALATDVDKANGIGVDLTDKKVEAEIETMKKQVTGKRHALQGCTFSMQGNDEVTFGAEGTDKTLPCKMKGGEAAVKEFRHAAMAIENTAKMRLDVSGVIALAGTKGYERMKMTGCEISVHQ
jgi:hypothetical protein